MNIKIDQWTVPCEPEDIIGINNIRLTVMPGSNSALHAGDLINLLFGSGAVKPESKLIEFKMRQPFYKVENTEMLFDESIWQQAPIFFVEKANQNNEITQVHTYFDTPNTRNELLQQCQELYANKTNIICPVCIRPLKRNKRIYITINGELIGEKCFEEVTHNLGVNYSRLYDSLFDIYKYYERSQEERLPELQKTMDEWVKHVKQEVQKANIDLTPEDVLERLATKGNWNFSDYTKGSYRLDRVSVKDFLRQRERALNPNHKPRKHTKGLVKENFKALLDENLDILENLAPDRFSNNEEHLTRAKALEFFNLFCEEASLVEGTDPKLINATQQIFKLGFTGFLRNHLGSYNKFPKISELEPIGLLAKKAVTGQQLVNFKSTLHLTSYIIDYDKGEELNHAFL